MSYCGSHTHSYEDKNFSWVKKFGSSASFAKVLPPKITRYTVYMYYYTYTHTHTHSVPDGGPQNFMAVTITATQVTLSWSRPAIPNGLIIMYTLVYSNSTLSMSQVIPYSENVSDFEVAGLNEFTSYSFAVNASTSVGAGPAAVLNITSAEAGTYSVMILH